MSVLDAATNDLARLITHLDLEATPGAPDRSPIAPSLSSVDKERMRFASRKFAMALKGSGEGNDNASESPTVRERVLALESPIKQKKAGKGNDDAPSITSLRAYAQTKTVRAAKDEKTGNLIGQQIAPWPTLNWTASASPPPPPPPSKPAAVTPPSTSAPFMTHKRTLTPGPAADPPPVFQPLRQAVRKGTQTIKVSPPPSLSSSVNTPPSNPALRTPSSLTFGSHSPMEKDEDGSGAPTPGPVFRKAHRHERKQSLLAPAELQQSKQNHVESMPMASETKRNLGMSGTMGSSAGSAYARALLGDATDARDVDSDIPDDLKAILAGRRADDSSEFVEDTLSYRPECTDGSPVSLSMTGPPTIPLPDIVTSSASSCAPTVEVPVFRASVVDEDDNHADIDDFAASSSEDDTKKSFDFTGELQKLNQSGASDRRSFVEQLENAFRTPAKIDLRYGFGDSLEVEIPPVPKAPTPPMEMVTEEPSTSIDASADNFSLPVDTRRIEPTMLAGSDSLAVSEDSRDEFFPPPPHCELKTSMSSVGSRPSNGELNKDFRFGGRPSPSQGPFQKQQPLNLSDIIPPPSRVRAMSTGSMIDDNSVLISILANAIEIRSTSSRMRVDSDSSSKRQARELSKVSQEQAHGHGRQDSSISFAGLDSFAEIRRGFEFAQERPAFYPPPAATRRKHGKQESMFSIASVSSYGRVINPGSTDPFEFGDSRLPDIPQSEDDSISMSMSVDDTFSFIHRDSRDPRRRRVDSDASSFYFRAPAHSHMMQPYHRGHRRHDSAFSVVSVAPPVSLHDRSFVAHRRNDSNTSASSMAFSYAMHGASSGRAAWARHHHDASVDSVNSDISARRRLGRPGLGDKMLESALDYGMPLTSISASPPESAGGKHPGDRTSYDSIMDDEGRRSSTDYEDRRSCSDDSLFDKTGHRSSVSSESVFGYDDSHPPQGNLLPPNQFRPVSMISIASIHSPNKEDDTMISVSLSYSPPFFFLTVSLSDVGWWPYSAKIGCFSHRSFALRAS